MIYNPAAGALRGNTSRLAKTMEILTQAGLHVETFATTGPTEATRFARQSVDSGADLILAAGGDGTINAVLNGMVPSRVPLGLLPGGTANVLAMELGLGKQMSQTAARLTNLVPTRIAVGVLRAAAGVSRYFLLMAGVGLDAGIVAQVNPALKKKVGKLAYWLAGFEQLGHRIAQLEVRADGETLTGGFALASRVRNYGGDLEIARTASLLKDSFELVVFEGESSWRYLKYFGGVVSGRLRNMDGVSIRHTCKVEFSAPPDRNIQIQIDGEHAGAIPATVEIVPDALTLLAPPSFLKQKPR